MSLGRVGDSHSRTEVQISAHCNFSTLQMENKPNQLSVLSSTIYSMAKQVHFSEVEQIVKNTKKEEIRRRMSHGELLRSFNNGNGTNISGSNNGSFNNGFNNGSNNGSFNGSDVQSTNGEEEKTVFFDAQV